MFIQQKAASFLTPKMKLDACGAHILLRGTQIEFEIYFPNFIRVGSLLICLLSLYFWRTILERSDINNGGNIIE